MKNNFKVIRNLLCNMILSLYLIGVIFIPIDLYITNKIIVATGAISFILLFFTSLRDYKRSLVVLASGLLLLGALDLVWYELYKTNQAIYINSYRGYLEAGKMFVFSSFTFLLLINNNFNISLKYHVTIAFLTQILVISRACYQYVILSADRIPLSAMSGNIGQMGAATIAAYAITFCALYSSIVFLKLESKYKWIAFYTNFALVFVALLMTGTRAAIITFPFLIIAMLFIYHRERKVLILKGIGGVLILLLGCGLLFSKEIEQRAIALKNDINLYLVKNNSLSSVGARFSMIQAGIEGAPKGLEWQSLEQRAININELSNKNNIYKGAVEFLGVHMHNEIVEALSTKGFLGVIVLFFFYGALIYYCLREKKYLLLVFPASIMLFGISDVITHDKPIPASWIVCLFLSASLLGKKDKHC